MQEKAIICHVCGRGIEHLAGRLPCEELTGWFMLSWWKGREYVDHYSFCSVDCLRRWSENQGTTVPDVFLKSFDE